MSALAAADGCSCGSSHAGDLINHAKDAHHVVDVRKLTKRRERRGREVACALVCQVDPQPRRYEPPLKSSDQLQGGLDIIRSWQRVDVPVGAKVRFSCATSTTRQQACRWYDSPILAHQI